MKKYLILVLFFTLLGIACEEKTKPPAEETVKEPAKPRIFQLAESKGYRVRVRAEPAVFDSEILDHLAKGDKVTILNRTDEKDKLKDLEDYWYEVRLENGTQGWVFGHYLELTPKRDVNP